MRIARLRALTHSISSTISEKVYSVCRNEDCPTEGIDTPLVLIIYPLFCFPGRNEDCPTEGIDTFFSYLPSSYILISRNEDCPTEGIDTAHYFLSACLMSRGRNEDCPTEGIDT